jgi:hypothetical protein
MRPQSRHGLANDVKKGSHKFVMRARASALVLWAYARPHGR